MRSEPRRLLASLAWLGCALMAIVVVTSAYLRLTQFGVGCEPWPQCYGSLGAEEAAAPATSIWLARLLHRFAAMAVGLVTLGAWVSGLRRGARDAVNVATTFALLVLTVVLALIGQRSAGSVVPLVGIVNLGGGFAMLALFALLLRNNRPADTSVTPAQRAALLCMALVLLAHAALGALVSVTYSADACVGAFTCGARIGEAPAALATLDPMRALNLDAIRRIVPASGAPALHLLHRSTGIALGGLAVLVSAWLARSEAQRRRAMLLGLVACALLLSGWAMIELSWRLAATLLHNASAALLIALAAAYAAPSRSRAMP